jgi:hypothetical protein
MDEQGRSRVAELCAEFGIHDADTLKHRLEDWERWRRDVPQMDVQLASLSDLVRDWRKRAGGAFFETREAYGRGGFAASDERFAVQETYDKCAFELKQIVERASRA